MFFRKNNHRGKKCAWFHAVHLREHDFFAVNLLKHYLLLVNHPKYKLQVVNFMRKTSC